MGVNSKYYKAQDGKSLRFQHPKIYLSLEYIEKANEILKNICKKFFLNIVNEPDDIKSSF